jgi:hypothetical protein
MSILTYHFHICSPGSLSLQQLFDGLHSGDIKWVDTRVKARHKEAQKEQQPTTSGGHP